MDRDECRRHGGHDSGKLEKGRGGFRQKTILGTANALAEMHQRPGEPGEAGGVKRVAAVGVWFQTAGKGMEGLSTNRCLCAAGSVAEMWPKHRGQPTSGVGGGIPEC